MKAHQRNKVGKESFQVSGVMAQKKICKEAEKGVWGKSQRIRAGRRSKQYVQERHGQGKTQSNNWETSSWNDFWFWGEWQENDENLEKNETDLWKESCNTKY